MLLSNRSKGSVERLHTKVLRLNLHAAQESQFNNLSPKAALQLEWLRLVLVAWGCFGSLRTKLLCLNLRALRAAGIQTCYFVTFQQVQCWR
jgi:hypothetical protein